MVDSAPLAVQGVGWDLTSEYPAANSTEIDADLKSAGTILADIERRNDALIPFLDGVATLKAESAGGAIAEAREIFVLIERVRKLVRDPETYAECCLSVDSQDEQAQALLGRLQSINKRFDELAEPLGQFLDLAPEEVVESYLEDPVLAPARFSVEHSRRRRHELLPLAEENLVTGLGDDGIHAWGRLYDQLSGTLSCAVTVGNELRTTGLAEAAGLMQRPDDRLRENAWRAINAAWDGHAESCAAAINAIAGWRLEMCRKRSARAGTTIHYLDAPLHANRIQRETLATVLKVAEEGIPLARRAALLQAKAYGKSHYGPWDNRAPAPVPDGDADAPIAYGEALDLIARAYGEVDPSMGNFVRMMAERNWIEGTVGPHKRPGAYCTGFLKSRTPRVYMTYTGGSSDVITLAHELGHAFHSWVMRDLPDSQRRYGMSIAETASTFGETIVRNALLRRAKSPAAVLDIVWEEAAALVTFVLNIPTRFEFERNFYDARADRPLSPKELKAMMSAAWGKWYGESIAEGDPLFWASKLHFYISGLSFYNFPYLFGYLFSLGVYARREAFGDEFFPRYKALLMDTGRMTTEDLAAKHLDVDLTQPDFWRDTLAMIEPRIDHFEALVNARTQS
ncbi:MAG: M3 family oligoendopeptidase [Gammaproteobacteria bacterium]|nr:M3 family oligoendopeptidase [Gammaproteobacteria bacterium]